MTPEQQRIAIAEACGWEISMKGMVPENHQHAKPPGGSWGYFDKVPDYLKDRNAMHDALSTLTDNQGIMFCYFLNEMGIVGEWDILTAKLDVLAEAFLRAVGRWVEP